VIFFFLLFFSTQWGMLNSYSHSVYAENSHVVYIYIIDLEAVHFYKDPNLVLYLKKDQGPAAPLPSSALSRE
jgi:hypothetical protein